WNLSKWCLHYSFRPRLSLNVYRPGHWSPTNAGLDDVENPNQYNVNSRASHQVYAGRPGNDVVLNAVPVTLCNHPHRKDSNKCKRWHRKYTTLLHICGRELAGIAQLLWLSVSSYKEKTRIAMTLIPCATATERSNASKGGKNSHHLTRTITLPSAWQWIL